MLVIVGWFRPVLKNSLEHYLERHRETLNTSVSTG